jgi:hypothetical protein
MLFISVDGNFRLQRKRKNDDLHDKGLNAGNGYFVNGTLFAEYLKGLEATEVVSYSKRHLS